MMRAAALSIAMVFSITSICGAEPQQREPSDDLQIEAAQDRGIEPWQGRQHWLYDQDNQPETNALARREQHCAEYRVRTPRADGGSDVKRVEKCN